jgi:hypothetical protein
MLARGSHARVGGSPCDLSLLRVPAKDRNTHDDVARSAAVKRIPSSMKETIGLSRSQSFDPRSGVIIWLMAGPVIGSVAGATN